MGKGSETRVLTEQQAVFAREYARNGGNGAEAARAADFSEQSAGKYAYQLLEKPHVLKAIQTEQRRSLTDLASVALGQVRLMLEDPKTPAGARVELMRTVLDRAGLGPPKGDEDEAGDKPIRELSLVQLEAMAMRAVFRPVPDAPAMAAGPLLEGVATQGGGQRVPEGDDAREAE